MHLASVSPVGTQAGARGSTAAPIELRAIAFVEVSAADPPAAAGPVPSALRSGGGELIQVLHRVVLAVFDSATACLETCRRLPASVRAGLTCGDILFEQGLVYGVPVVEAARLKDAASDGQVLCTRRLVRVADLPDGVFRETGELQVKGLADPIETFELRRG